MNIYTGIDAIEIERIENAMKKPGFLKRILGPCEYKYYESEGFPPQSIAGAFCAKEAFSKALGTGFRGFSLSDVQVMHDMLGKPYYVFSGFAAEVVNERNITFDLSITHTKTTAMAVAIGVKA